MVRETDPRKAENRIANAPVGRRQILAAVGMGAIAGCMGGDGEDEDDGGDGSGGGGGGGGSGTPVTDTFSAYISPDTSIERIGFNHWNPTTGAPQVVDELNYMPPMRYNINEAQWEPRILSEWEMSDSNEEVTFTIDDGFNWANGEPVTSRDFWVDAQLELGMYDGTTGYYNDFTIEDEQTFTLHLEEGINSNVLFDNLRLQHRYREGPYRDLADRFAEASEDEYESLQGELEEFTVGPDDLHTSGPFVVDEVSESYWTLVPNDGFKYRDSINFEKVELIQAGDWSTVQGMLMSEQLDTAGGAARFSNSFVENVPDRYYTYYSPRFGGPSIDFQLNDPIYSIREVRQALNHIFDRETAVNGVDFELIPDQYTTGMTDDVATAYLDEEALNSFTDYTGQNYEEARALLQDAGFEEGSNGWLTPEGEEWTMTLRAPAGDSDRIQLMDLATGQFEDFGINAELETIETSTYWQRYREQNWEVATYAYGDRYSSHPYSDFYFQYIGEDPDQNPGVRAPWAGTPYEVEAPMPVGDPDGSLETIDYYDKITSIRTTQDEEEVQQILEECAWIYNQLSFKIPIAVEALPVFADTQDWVMPEDKEEAFTSFNRAWWRPLVLKGELQAQER